MRDDENDELLYTRRIFQQYIIDVFKNFETQRLNFFFFNPHLFRMEVFQGHLNVLRRCERDATKIEFKKRGLPHVPFLIILCNKYKLLTPKSYDIIIRAELPDSNKEAYLHSVVVHHMVNGPCGHLNPTNPCLKSKGHCKFKYTKDIFEQTLKGKNSYPIYRRQHTREHIKVRGQYLDNSRVVPYNPFLLAKFNCHMNVKICSTLMLSKKDKQIEVDEIKEHQSTRWVSLPKATWCLFGYPINEMMPSVYHLQ
ncbi:hypothetical protein H5410_046626 [Solanum commersonii]|uniref:Helitron helicase-like domain-containing protein n=1 Tax=Solanum commersonii TaxID=4109 RepID=A0A9J5XGZ4_SOLCO|nr:hypothetical protein H5410_046626 [Solanum commersonii]